MDHNLIQALHKNARLSNAALARQVGLSAPSVAERLRRLEEAGVIGGYRPEINPAALGLTVTAWLRIRPMPGELHRVADILLGLPEIVECHRITGDDCFLARAHVPSVQALETVIDALISYASTNTSIEQSSPVERRLPDLPRKR
ncbi:MAG: Lrp/AsnC family transcriptional regulator [Magnetovibrionaceae bacterium]